MAVNRRLVLSLDDATLTRLEIQAAGGGVPRRIGCPVGNFSHAIEATYPYPNAFYKCDEPSGAVLYDASGNAIHGTIDSATYNASGKEGRCLQTTGTRLATVAKNAAFEPAWDEPWSLEYWWYRNSGPPTGPMVTYLQTNGGGQGWQVWIDVSGIYFAIVGPSAQTLYAYAFGADMTPRFMQNGWNHIVYTFSAEKSINNSVVGGGIDLWINGFRYPINNAGGSLSSAIDYTSAELKIAGGPTGWGNMQADEAIDNIAFYKGRVLSEARIKQHYLGVTWGQALWSFNLGAGRTIKEIAVPGPFDNHRSPGDSFLPGGLDIGIDGGSRFQYYPGVDADLSAGAGAVVVGLTIAPDPDDLNDPYIGGPAGEGPVVIYEEADPVVNTGGAQASFSPSAFPHPGFITALARTTGVIRAHSTPATVVLGD